MQLLYRILAISWGILILFSSLTKGADLPDIHILNADKVAHFFVYFVWIIITGLGWRNNDRTQAKKILLMAVVLQIAVGYGIEYLQGCCIAGRTNDVYDFIADCCGSVLGGLVLYYYVVRKA